MVKDVSPLLGRFNRYRKILLCSLLADILFKAAGAERSRDAVFVRPDSLFFQPDVERSAGRIKQVPAWTFQTFVLPVFQVLHFLAHALSLRNDSRITSAMAVAPFCTTTRTVRSA